MSAMSQKKLALVDVRLCYDYQLSKVGRSFDDEVTVTGNFPRFQR